MNESPKPVLLSLKPHYADLVFEGVKKAELRKRALAQMEGRDVFVYVTSPIMQLRGGFRVGAVWSGTPNDIWEQVSEMAGVDKCEFDAYYEGRSKAYALEITGVWEYADPPGLNTLRSLVDNFVVPQSWRYVKPDEQRYFMEIGRTVESKRCDQKPSEARHENVPLIKRAIPV